MKKILTLFLFVFSIISYSQIEKFGGTPATGVTPIKREISIQPNVALQERTAPPIDGGNGGDPPTTTGTSTEVGVTEGQLSVSLTGGATYTIPIAVPPGINGVVPQISLSYNSQGGNGLAGYGWNIAGVSVITRIPATKFHDGTIDGVDFNSMDRFAFDGQRLMVKNGTAGVYGANGTVYETESFSNVQITSYGVHPNGANYGPAYFIVQYPDGSFAQYGNSTDSRSITDWAITYWQNPQGVRISYFYTLANNNLSIATIKYGTRLTTTPINEIAFVYKNRVRPEQAYIGGQSFVRTTILSEIRVKGNNIGFRNYILAHETTSLGYERLVSITEKNGDNTKSFNPTVFSYETTTNSGLFQMSNPYNLSVGGISSNNSSYINGDFDGDGKTDFILYPTTGVDAKKKYWLFSNIQGNSLNIGAEHILGSKFDEIFPISWLGGSSTLGYKLMPAQGWCAVTTNAATNITSFTNYSTGSTSPIYTQDIKTYLFPKYDTDVDALDYSGMTADNLKEIPKKYVSGDFNGDGISDVLAIEQNVSFYICTQYGNPGGLSKPPCIAGYDINYSGQSYFVNLDRRLTLNYVVESGGVNINASSKLEVADVNGDGKSDLIVFEPGSIRVYYLNDSDQLVQYISKTDGSIILNKPRLMGDYNGDGKMDFVIPQADNSDSWSFFFSKGNDFQKITTGIGLDYYLPDTGYYAWSGFDLNTYSLFMPNYFANDFNGDGKTDIVLQGNFTIEYIMTHDGADYSNYGDPQVTNFVVLENKFTNGAGIGFNYNYINSQYCGLRTGAMPMFLDHNNINQNLEYAVVTGNIIKIFKSTKDNKNDTQLKQITLGNGVKENITYDKLNYDSDNPTSSIFMPSTYTENYPNFDIKTANSFQVVSRLEKTSATQYAKQDFKYYGAVSNVEGLGFLGFRALARTNWYNDNHAIITSVSKHDVSKRGAIFETYSALGQVLNDFFSTSPTSYISKSLMTYSDVLLVNKVYKISNTATTALNGLENTSIETTSTYNTNNNPLTTTTLYKNGSTTEKTEIVTIIYDAVYTSGSSRMVDRIKQKNSTITHNGDTMTGEEKYVYTASMLVSNIQKKGHNTNYLTEANIYDVFGNITKKTITAVGLTPRVTNFVYDTSGRFLTSSTDIEGLVSTYTYNTSNGLLLTKTLPSNSGYPLITTYLYDTWGKKIKETDYLGKNINIAYAWLDASQYVTGAYSMSVTGDDGSYSTTWFDDLGRTVAEGSKCINDVSSSQTNMIWNYTDYDIYDRATYTFEPELTTDPQWGSLYNATTYDDYGRPTQIVQHTGKTTTISYSGLTVTTNDGVSTTSTTKNSIGNIVSKTDNGGTITYQYYANGNLKQSNFGGVVVALEQDGWGRKKKLTDPSAGIYQYTYNDFGETLTETTPKGVTTYTLDAIGKVTQKTIVGTGGDATNSKNVYTYDTTSKLLTNINYSDFTNSFYLQYSYGYDNYKRLNFSDENGPNAYYQRATQFDTFGRPLKELYTAINTTDGKRSDKWVRNTYKNGYHWQILDDATSQILWQTTAVNERGQLVKGNYGNGIEINNQYDGYGYPTQFKHDKTGNPVVNVMTLNTVFEPQRGNLTSRTNSLFTISESFTYDNLDRLKTYPNIATGTVRQQDYDSLGRIATNELGGYNYTVTGKQFQNSDIDVNDLTIDYYQNRTGIFYNGMEQGEGWLINNDTNITYDTTQHKSGSKSLKINNPNSTEKVINAENWVLINNAVPTQYTYSAWVKSNGTNPQAELFLFMKTDTETGYFSMVDSQTLTTSTTWTLIQKTFTVPANIKKISIRLDNNAAGVLWFDDVRIVKTADVLNGTRALSATYNAFKSPVTLSETNKGSYDFLYNMNNSRATMYYGGTQTDKLQRQYRKHYSADGSMEIKQDIVNNTVEFITYIGGDGYTAPVILKSDGTTQSYYYLHRDYLGSIVAITDQNATVVEKRHFDAWGNVVKIQDAQGNILTSFAILDRGYTGHEHLQDINIIHMNGRLYDPVLHRFMQPDNFIQDPTNTQNFNRYSYVMNNPLKYTDASGEIVWAAVAVAAIIGAACGGASYVAHAIQTGNWSWSNFGMSVLIGAAVGAVSGAISPMSIFSTTLGQAVASSFVSAFFPAINIPIGDWNISMSPSIAFGNASGSGVNIGVGYSDGDWSFSGGVGLNSYNNYNNFGANAREIRYSALVNYDDGKTGFSLGTNLWRGDNFHQRTGMIGFHNGDFKAMYENDGGIGIKHMFLGDRGDSYRTAALNLSVGDFSTGFNLFTGYRGRKDNQKYEKRDLEIIRYKRNGKAVYGYPVVNAKDSFGRNYKRGFVHETGTKYRLGALSVGYKGYSTGYNSEKVRHAIQDTVIHGAIKDKGFENQSWDWGSGYFQYQTPNIFTSW